MDEIKQIKPSGSESLRDHAAKHEDEGSVLIPQLGMNADSTKTPSSEKPSVDRENMSNVVSKNKTMEKVNFKPDKDKTKKKKKRFPKWAKITSIVILLVILILAGIGGYIVLLGKQVYNDGLVLRASAEKLVDAGKVPDLPLVKQELITTRSSLDSFEKSYAKLLWLSNVPYVNSYILDGTHVINAAYHGFDAADIVILAIEPYADILGLAEGGNASDGAETAQDRLDFIVSTIPDLIPQADALSDKVSALRSEIDYIDADRYPEEFKGISVRKQLKKAIELIDMGDDFLARGKPLLRVAPDLLGTDEPRTYLVLFQNDKELRATGGFLTAYSIATVEKGKFKPVSSNDIYNLDDNYRPSVPAPDPVRRMLKGPYTLSSNFRLRDMNWSPDFRDSMELFLAEAKKVGIGDIDGIVAVDTQLVVNLLDVLGPIGVPGYGDFSTENDPRCNCPNVVYELESFADVEGSVVWDQLDPTKIIFAPDNYGNRKEIIGPMMNSILSNALGQSKEKIPRLFEAGFNSVIEKHVLLYLVDESEQAAVEQFGIAGKIVSTDNDYLHINDSNLGGRKSNLYVTQQVEQEIEIANDGTVTKTVVITYTNTEKHDGWLNSVLPSWLRIYVPEGSQLVDLQGLENTADPYSDLGKTVFAGQYELRPEGVARIEVSYTLPFKATGDKYDLLIQKQPGTDAPLHTIILGNYEEEMFLKVDKELEIRI